MVCPTAHCLLLAAMALVSPGFCMVEQKWFCSGIGGTVGGCEFVQELINAAMLTSMMNKKCFIILCRFKFYIPSLRAISRTSLTTAVHSPSVPSFAILRNFAWVGLGTRLQCDKHIMRLPGICSVQLGTAHDFLCFFIG